MAWWLAVIAEFLGKVLAALIPAFGREIRRNHVGKQIGGDDDTKEALDRSVRAAVGGDR